MKKLILIDGNALVHRAFHALPPLKAPNGMVSNAIFGFASILIKTIKDLKPDYMAAAFDLAGPTFRHEEYEEYKAHREKAPDELYAQEPIIKEFLRAFGVPIYEKEGFEADDLIGTLSKRGAKEKDIQVIILSGDLDTLQLVEGEKIMVYTLRKGMTDTVLYDDKMVKVRYGGLSPAQMTDFKGLKGDPSDNIPGVPGVGEKTAIMLIHKYGSIEKMYEAIENNEKPLPQGITERLRQKLLENKDKAIFSKHLSIIITDLDVDFSLTKADWARNLKLNEVEKIFKELAFYSLIKKLSELKAIKQEGLFFENPVVREEGRESSAGGSISEIKGRKDLENIIKKIIAKKIFSLFLDKENIYISFDGESVHGVDKLEDITDLLKDKTIKKIMHQAKDAIKLFIKRSIYPQNIFDTAIAAYLINPDQKDYDFDKLYFQEFQTSPPSEKKNWPVYILRLKERLWEKIKEQKLINVFEDIEMPLMPVLAEMENTGIKIDVESISNLSKVINEELKKLENNIYKKAGTQFNINSPQQLSEILFQRLGLKGKVRKTGGGAKSTAASELEKLIDEHPIIELILQYRELQKLKTTYIDPFPQLVAEDGRIHTTFNQTGTGTGRLASENPNLQNIPIKTELGQEFRKSFVPEKGYCLVSFDYSQLELRIVAHISNDEKMINAFLKGEDIHTRTAAEIFGVDPKNVTLAMRRQAKVLNFGVIYGMGVMGFARAAGVDRNRAREFITKYINEFSGVAKYMEDIKSKAKEFGYVQTLFGRRRQIPEIFATIPEVMHQGERMAINAPIQGSGADMMKIAMVRINNLIHGRYKKDEVRMLLQVHDELLFEIKEKYIKEFAGEAKKTMEEVIKLKVPLLVDVKMGDNWAEMGKID